MTDINNSPLSVGDTCVYLARADDPERNTYMGRTVYVRAVKPNNVRIDDGDPKNHDLFSNGYRWSAWIKDGNELRKIDGAA